MTILLSWLRGEWLWVTLAPSQHSSSIITLRDTLRDIVTPGDAGPRHWLAQCDWSEQWTGRQVNHVYLQSTIKRSLRVAQQNTRFELPVTTPFQPYKPLLHAGSWLESTLVQNNKIKNKVWFFLLLLHWNMRLKGLIWIQSHSDI